MYSLRLMTAFRDIHCRCCERMYPFHNDGQRHFGVVFLAPVQSRMARTEVVDTNGSGHGALAGFLLQNGVDTLICGGIGGGAQAALAEAGIKLYGGVSGDADAAVSALLNGSLGYDPNVH